MKVVRYTPEHEAAWNCLVAASKNGTFLFDRGFMDYHSHRFCDCSLLFVKEGKVVGALPANFVEDEGTVYSHQGLTYGGLILPVNATAVEVMEMMDAACDFYRNELGATHMVYRAVPYIYNRYPSEEPLYALFRHEARLTARGLSSAIPLEGALPFVRLRRRGVVKAEDWGVRLTAAHSPSGETEGGRSEILQFWSILRSGLVRRHGVEPVHSAEEIQLLTDRFPHNIRLMLVRHADGNIVAGAWLFLCGPVVHVQYMAASDEAREHGVNDWLTATLLDLYARHDAHKPAYYEFGISTEQSGHVLNEGLIFQKEGFGARGVCYDTYEIAL